MGLFKEKQIEKTDELMQELDLLRKFYLEQGDQDECSLYFPQYESELGGFLPHERRSVSADVLMDLFKRNK